MSDMQKIEVVKQSLECSYKTFYPLNNSTKAKTKNIRCIIDSADSFTIADLKAKAENC